MKYVVIGIYVFVLLAIGYVSMKKPTASMTFSWEPDHRSLGSAFAYGTTYFSAVIFIGYAGKIGWGLVCLPCGLWRATLSIGTYLAWKVLAKPTGKSHARRSPDHAGLLAKRYDSPSLKIAAALIIFIF